MVDICNHIVLQQIAVVVGRSATAELYDVVFEAFAVIDAKMNKAKNPADTPPTDSALSGMYLTFGFGLLNTMS